MPMTVEDLPEANRVGDPPADVLVAELLDSDHIPNDLFRTIGTLFTRHPQQLPRLQEFLRKAVAPPPGWMAEDVRRGESFFSTSTAATCSLASTTPTSPPRNRTWPWTG